MKGWYGNPHKHSLASRGIKTKYEDDWRKGKSVERGLVAEVPIDWLWKFRTERGQLPSDWDEWSEEKKRVIEGMGGVDLIIKIERENIERIKEDISKNGLQTPLILDVGRDDGRVVLGEGNHRLVALKELGYEKVPVIVSVANFTFGGIEYPTDVQKTVYFPSYASPLHVFSELEGYTPHPDLKERDWKEEYR